MINKPRQLTALSFCSVSLSLSLFVSDLFSAKFSFCANLILVPMKLEVKGLFKGNFDELSLNYEGQEFEVLLKFRVQR